MKPDVHKSPPRGRFYPIVMIGSAALMLLGALAAFSYALNFNVGPLEGLQMDASGNLAPEEDIRVGLITLDMPLEPGAVSPCDPELERQRWRDLLAIPGFEVKPIPLSALPGDLSSVDVVVVPWGSSLEPEHRERLRDFLTAGGAVMGLGPLGPLGEGVASLEALDAEGNPPQPPLRRGESRTSLVTGQRRDYYNTPDPLRRGESRTSFVTPAVAGEGSGEGASARSEPPLATPAVAGGLEPTPSRGTPETALALHTPPIPTAAELFGVTWMPTPAGLIGPLQLRPRARGLVDATLPEGYHLQVNLEAIRDAGIGIVPEGATAEATLFDAREPAKWKVRQAPDAAESPSTEASRGSVPAPAAIVLSEFARGRTAWLAFPITQLFRNRQRDVQVQRLVTTLVRYLARRPIVTTLPWPDSGWSRVGLAITVDHLQGAYALARQLEQRGLEATWFVAGDTPELDPETLTWLDRTGEVALLGTPNIQSLSRSRLAARHISHAAAFHRILGYSPRGYREPFLRDPRMLRESLAAVGIQYILTNPPADRTVPRWIELESGVRLLKLPPPAVDLGARPHTEEEATWSLLDRLEHTRADLKAHRLTILELPSHVASGDTAEEIPALLDRLAAQDGFQVQTLATLAQQWRVRETLGVMSRQLRPTRLHLRLMGSDAALDGLTVRIFLPHDARPKRLISHHLLPSHGMVHRRGPGLVEITFDRIGAGRIQDYFLELEPLDGPQRALIVPRSNG